MSPSKKRGGDDTLSDADDGGPSSKSMKCNNEVDEPFASDDELPDESVEDHLSWRKDDSYSDWTIIIKVATTMSSGEKMDNSNSNSSSIGDENKNKEFTHKVHKERLAVGPRRSGYFGCLFANDGNFSEGQDNTSRIELDEFQAKVFPELLDYMYTTGQKVKFSTENACALYSLAKYFDMQRLRHEAKQFFLQDICRRTWSTYYEQAKLLQEDGILQSATKFLDNNIQHFDLNENEDIQIMQRISKITDTQFWLDLMEKSYEQGTISTISNNLSLFVTYFILRHGLSPEVFTQLTDEKYLPNEGIDPEAAIVLLDLEHRIIGNDKNHSNGHTQNQLSNLQIRCVNAIVRCGKKVTWLMDVYAEEFQNFSPLILCEIIKRSFNGIPPTEQQQQQQQPAGA